MSRAPRILPAALRAVLAAELGSGPRIEGLCGELLAVRGYSRPLALALIAAAAGRGGESWEERRVAVLLLQMQVLALRRADHAELDLLLAALGVKEAGLGRSLPPGVLAEGYSSVEPVRFHAELRRRLLPARRAAAGLRGAAAPESAWSGFLAVARAECRLPLARYVFSPAEVVARVRGRVRLSRGVPDPLPESPAAAPEARRLLDGLPPYEAEICRLLTRDAAIHWAGEETGSALGSLVSQPPGTVVLIVRPPGSEIEIELKRAGRPGSHPLSAVEARDGVAVPPSHRLDGGSMGPLLQWEARSAARLCRLYRRLHGEEAPVSRTLAIASVYTVPAPAGGEAHVLDYFTDPAAFGPGFAAMRREMGRCLEAWRREGSGGGLGVGGDLGVTLEFLRQAAPRQAVLVGTSALRLDRAARYLAPGGAEAYFAEALGRGPAEGEARRWADELLAEVLGELTPPRVPYVSHEGYLAAAFAVPANRRRADRAFLALARQLGRLWGTVAACRGGSWGESFVARNIGLRCRWQGGRRRVGLVAMDHDRLTFAANGGPRALALRQAQALDRRYVLGDPRVRGSVEYLAEIYRAGEDLARRGRQALLAAAGSVSRHPSFTTARQRSEREAPRQLHSPFTTPVPRREIS